MGRMHDMRLALDSFRDVARSRAMTKGYAAFALAWLASPLAADDTTLVILSEPSAADYAAAQQAVEPVIAKLEAGEPKEAVDLITSKSEIFASKATELNVLVGQVRTMYDIYGPVEKCIATERDHASELRVKFTYICQHREFLIRWNFTVDNVPKGWIVTNFRFSDTF